ncbi:prolyl-tRNA synthetase associated domain-containing protein [Ahrensia kielensis]|uniref:prolyl-tRNA synthetase associated domain-containing protein n=1 Tax=Ahrensia kielensis TaxID=76980 RepID=UPI000376808B|nr:YbaK/EbsC family protein [Ahrensia kielensis]
MKSSNDLFSFLSELSIDVKNTEHEAVFTVAESQALRDEIGGGHTKNLFLKDKKGRYFLLTVLEDAEINLKTVHQKIGAQGRVSFGKPESLMEYLGVMPGSVTAFGIINDTDNQVSLILDARLMENDIINCHPLRNTVTTSIAVEDLKKFVTATDHALQIIALDEKPTS